MTYHDVVTQARKPSRSRTSLSVAAVCTAAALLLAGCGGLGGAGGGSKSSTRSDTTKTTFAPNSTMGIIKQRGSLIVGIRYDAAPFATKDASTGSPSGFDVDLVKSIATAIFGSTSIEGKIRWVPLDPRDNELALEQNKVDIVVGRYAVTPARKTFVDFAGPYFSDPQSLMVDTRQEGQGADLPKAVADFNGQKVCAVTGGTDVPALLALAPSVNVSDVRKTINECGADLITGLVVGIADNRVDELQYLKNSSTLQVLQGTYAPQLYGIGVKKNTDDFRAFLNDQIDAFKWDEAFTAWISNSSDSINKPVVDRY